MFSKNTKFTSLLWIAILGLVLTTIYTLILTILGTKTMKRIEYIYKKTRQENSN